MLYALLTSKSQFSSKSKFVENGPESMVKIIVHNTRTVDRNVNCLCVLFVFNITEGALNCVLNTRRFKKDFFLIFFFSKSFSAFFKEFSSLKLTFSTEAGKNCLKYNIFCYTIFSKVNFENRVFKVSRSVKCFRLKIF